jgi:Protein of unknown function (DUF3455)
MWLSNYNCATIKLHRNRIINMKTISLAILASFSLVVSIGLYGGSVLINPATATTPTVPAALAPPATEKIAFSLSGKGVQVYECRAKQDNAGQFEWAFKSTEAELFNDANAKVGKHYEGPTWEAEDGSKVKGEVKAKSDAPDATAIPWLLLEAKGAEGSGMFAKVKSIQQIDTMGGVAPTTICAQANSGTEEKVPYSATYNFYTAQ